VLRSWAVAKGLSVNPKEKRLAIQVDDHTVEYANFEGIIPKGKYGAGPVAIWDKGSFVLVEQWPDKITFKLNGNRLKGEFTLPPYLEHHSAPARVFTRVEALEIGHVGVPGKTKIPWVHSAIKGNIVWHNRGQGVHTDIICFIKTELIATLKDYPIPYLIHRAGALDFFDSNNEFIHRSFSACIDLP